MSLNQKNENMGGIFSPEFMFAEYVEMCSVVKQQASVYMECVQQWHSFPDCKTEISVQPNNDNMYDVSCIIRIPRSNITDEFRLLEKQLKMRPVVIRYLTANGMLCIIGSKINPLSLIVEETAPKVQDFNGMILSFSGVQQHRQLLYRSF